MNKNKISPKKKCCANCAFCAREQKQYSKQNENSHILFIKREEEREDLRDEKIEERILKQDFPLLYVGPYNEKDETNKIHDRYNNPLFQIKPQSIDNFIFCYKNQWLGNIFYYKEGWNSIVRKRLHDKVKCAFFFYYKDWDGSLEGLSEYLVQKREERTLKTAKYTLLVSIIALLISIIQNLYPTFKILIERFNGK